MIQFQSEVKRPLGHCWAQTWGLCFQFWVLGFFCGCKRSQPSGWEHQTGSYATSRGCQQGTKGGPRAGFCPMLALGMWDAIYPSAKFGATFKLDMKQGGQGILH